MASGNTSHVSSEDTPLARTNCRFACPSWVLSGKNYSQLKTILLGASRNAPKGTVRTFKCLGGEADPHRWWNEVHARGRICAI